MAKTAVSRTRHIRIAIPDASDDPIYILGTFNKAIRLLWSEYLDILPDKRWDELLEDARRALDTSHLPPGWEETRERLEAAIAEEPPKLNATITKADGKWVIDGSDSSGASFRSMPFESYEAARKILRRMKSHYPRSRP